MNAKITIVAMILIFSAVASHAQNPCDNPSHGNCMIPDTCCVVSPENCPWQYNLLDLTYMINFFRGGASPPNGNYGKFDVNCSCRFDGFDVVYLVNYLKGRGPAPLCCFYICPEVQKQNQNGEPSQKKY